MLFNTSQDETSSVQKNFLKALVVLQTAFFLSSCEEVAEDSTVSSSGISVSAEPQISVVASNNDIARSNTFAIDSKGNIFINDVNANIIRKLSPDGSVSVLANGVRCQFLLVDKSDNLFAIPYSTGAVSKISPTGIVTSVGNLQGNVYGAAIDDSANIFISLSATSQNTGVNQNKILKMTASGGVSVFAGDDQSGYVDANGINARFKNPQGLAFDSKGYLYVVDAGNSVIRKIDTQGNVSTYAGTSEYVFRNGSLNTAAFQFRAYGTQPEGLAISKDGDMFVGQKYGVGFLRYIGASGVVGTYCGNGQSDGLVVSGPCSQSPFYQTGTLVIGKDGYIYFNSGYGQIARIEINRAVISRKAPAVQLDNSILVVPSVLPTSIVIDNDFIYWGDSLPDNNESSIKKVGIRSSASVIAGIMTYGPVTTLVANTQFTSALALDSNQIYWMNNGQSNRISINGGAQTRLAYGYSTQIAVDQSGLYYGFTPVGLRKIDKVSGAITQLAPPSTTQYASPVAVAVSAGYVYSSDYFTGNLQKVSINGGASTILATGDNVSSLAADANNLYWSDRQGIHRVSIDGGASSILASEIDSAAGCLVLDSGSVYWATATAIKKVSVAGGAVTSIYGGNTPSTFPLGGFDEFVRTSVISRSTNGSVTSNCLAVNSDYVFFGKSNGLYRIAK